MPEAVEDLIADAVAVELNLGTQAWATLTNAAVRAYDTVFTQAQLVSLQAVCVPLRIDRERQTRGGIDQMDYEVTIDLQQAVSAASSITTQIEALNLTAQQMHDWFRVPHLLSGTSYECLKAERPEVFIPPRLWHDRVWESYIELTIRVYR